MSNGVQRRAGPHCRAAIMVDDGPSPGRIMMRVVALRVTVVAVVSAVLLGIAANPASADWYFADGLEAATSANWTVGGSGAGNSSRVYTTDCGLARSGCGGVVITQTGPGF